MSLLLLGLGVLSIVAIGVNPLGLGMVLFECLRAAMSLGTAADSAGWVSALAGRFGELRYVAAAFGGSPLLAGVLAWIGAILPFAALAFVWRRITPSTRLYTVGVVLVGLITGLALWLAVIGPRVPPA